MFRVVKIVNIVIIVVRASLNVIARVAKSPFDFVTIIGEFQGFNTLIFWSTSFTACTDITLYDS